jgi:hypothetical protein
MVGADQLCSARQKGVESCRVIICDLLAADSSESPHQVTLLNQGFDLATCPKMTGNCEKRNVFSS